MPLKAGVAYNSGKAMTTTLICVILGAMFLLLALLRLGKKLHHVPAPPYIGPFLDSNLRRFVQPADKLIERSGIKQGMTVLELGCGSGAYTTFVARSVGKQGKVYAVDIQSKMLRQLEVKLTRPEYVDIANVELRQASAYDLPFENESLDLVYMVTVLPEIPDMGRALQEIRRVLKEGGILSVTEFLPDPDYPLRSTTIKLCQGEGFILENNAGNMCNYTVRFRKPVSG